jgi:hypothetical protein
MPACLARTSACLGVRTPIFWLTTTSTLDLDLAGTPVTGELALAGGQSPRSADTRG